MPQEVQKFAAGRSEFFHLKDAVFRYDRSVKLVSLCLPTALCAERGAYAAQISESPLRRSQYAAAPIPPRGSAVVYLS